MRISMALAVVLMIGGSAHAGPFLRRSATTTKTINRPTVRAADVAATAPQRAVSGGGAQRHAESMAASCSLIHAASHGSTYEGVGVGGTPDAALASCCNNGKAVLEEGVAQGRDGRWYACRRYSQR